MVFAANVILAISLLAVQRSVLSSEILPPAVCEDVEKLSITTVDQKIFSVNDKRPVKDNDHIMAHDNNLKITVKMLGGPFNMVKSKVRTIRVIKIEWVCRDSGRDTIYKETELLTDIQKWQYTEIEDEEFLGCSDVQIKFTKSSNANKMGIKALTMDTCLKSTTGQCYAYPTLSDEVYQFNSDSMTNVMCMNDCRNKGFYYAITYSATACSCGNILITPLSPALCVTACPGDPTTRCGDGSRDYLTPTGL